MADDTTRHPIIADRTVILLSILTATLAVFLSAARIYYSISLSQPLQIMTSGDEVASIFAIWKAKEGLEIYTDRFIPPYALAVYNWLFYEAYANWSAFWISVVELDDAWIPNLSRIFSLAGCIAGAFGAYSLFRSMLQGTGSVAFLMATSMALLLVFGPLYGFWVITVRPDVWSISLEIIAVAIFLKLYPAKKIPAVIITALVMFAAWSFKHTTVFGLGGIGLFLLLRGDWRMLIALSAVSIGLWTITLLSIGGLFVETLFAIGHPLEYAASRLFRNVVNFTVKTPYLWLPLCCFAAVLARQGNARWLPGDDAQAVAICGVVMSLPTALGLMLQTGSSENYLFTPAFFLTMLLVSLISSTTPLADKAHRLVRHALLAGLILTSLSIAAVLAGQTGLIKPRGDQQVIDRQKACLDILPRPLFVTTHALSLPWMTPGNTPYVRSFYYERERKMGRAFANGGIGGMISKGTFEALIYPALTAPDKIDGADLDLYQALPLRCGGMTIFIRSARNDIHDITEALRSVE